MKLYVTVLFLVIFSLLFFSCTKKSAPTEPEYEYVPGEVIVGLVDTVTYQTAVNFFSSFNLEIITLDVGYVFWVKADSGNFEYYQEIFSSDSNIDYVDKLTIYEDDTLRMVIGCNGRTNIEEAKEKIEIIPTLHIFGIRIHPKHSLIRTEIGQEQYWIVILEQHEIVRYAELNGIYKWASQYSWRRVLKR